MPPGPDPDPDEPPSEVASLKREFDDLRETVQDLRAERQQTTQQLYQTLRSLGLSGEAIEANVSSLMGHGMTRRAAMLAVVGAVGGAGFMSGRVSAAASTSDSDGDVGTPSNRVDVFADGVDTLTVDAGTVTAGDLVNDISSDADIHASWNGLLSLYADTLGVSDAVDPSTTTTPLADAIAAVDTVGGATDGAGEIHLPPVPFDEDTPGVSPADNVSIIGKSTRGAKYGSEVTFTSTGSTTDHGFVMDGGDNLVLDRFSIIGPGTDKVTGVGMLFTGDPRAIQIPYLTINGWGNEAWRVESGSSPFETDIGYLKLNGDAGDKTALMNWQQSGPENQIDVLALSPNSGRTSADSTGLYAGADTMLSIGRINVGGTTGVAANIESKGVQIGHINYEPANQNAASHPHIVRFGSVIGVGSGDSVATEVRGVRHLTGTVDYAIEVDGAQGGTQLPRYVPSGGAVSNSIVEVASDIPDTVFYPGYSADVDNTTGSVLTGEVFCKGDGVFKSSTGTGYDGGADDRKV